MKNNTSSRFRLFLCLITGTLFTSHSSQAQCILGNDQGNFDPQNSFFWGQSFTADCDGTIEYVEWLTGGPGTQNAGTLAFFTGETISGTPTYSQDFPEMTFTAANESLRITFNTPITVNAGMKYTFETQVTTDLLISTSNPYANGLAFENGTAFDQVDFVFNVSITDNLSLENRGLQEQLSFYPNPAQDQIAIHLGKRYNDITMTVYNIIGDLVFQKVASNTDRMVAQIKELTAGVYLVRTETEDDNTVFRFVKK